MDWPCLNQHGTFTDSSGRSITVERDEQMEEEVRVGAGAGVGV